MATGVMYANFLTEIASHGYLVITTGVPDSITGGTKVSDMTRNIDWVVNSNATQKYGTIDKANIIAAGHSCGGLEALSGTYRDPRVKMTMLFNSGIPHEDTREKLTMLNKPIAYFDGAPKVDFVYTNGHLDFENMPKQVPVLFASLKGVSHLGTFFVDKGGKQASAAVDFLEWKTRGDEKKRALFCPQATNSSTQASNKAGTIVSASRLKDEGWSISSKNGMC